MNIFELVLRLDAIAIISMLLYIWVKDGEAIIDRCFKFLHRLRA